MTFVSFVDKIYPIKKMPRWIPRFYVFITSKYRALKSGPRKYPSWFEWKIRKPKQGFSSYTVVSPVYNMEKYLDDYFKSLTRQTLDFKKHIKLILVDDGSTDNSAQIIKKWQKKFPENISYIYQENQKINCARNKGIPLAKTPWVTWIDSDDFVHSEYFYEADKVLKKHALFKIKMLACRQIGYYEAKNSFQDNRPFRAFFEKGSTLRPHNDLGDYLHFTVNSAFFSVDEIRRQNISFAKDSDWRTFDDAHFVLRYLGDTEEGHTLFSRWPKYYYRKRADQTSNIDISHTRRQFFIEVLEEGYLGILKYYEKKNISIPAFVQRSIMYDMSWKIKLVFSKPQSTLILSPREKEKFLDLCDEIFSRIETETILSFPLQLSGFWYLYKVGTIHCFKKEKIDCEFAYVDDFDYKKELIRVRYYSSSSDVLEGDVYLDGMKIVPQFSKIIRRKFLTRTFIYEHHLWVRLSPTGRVTFQIGEQALKLDLGGKKFSSINSTQILWHYSDLLGEKSLPAPSAPWLLIDRDTQADDNAEHLYRHIAKNHPEKDIYFALRKSSFDWNRLSKDGFRLLDFGSKPFEDILQKASKLISSHMDHHIVQYKPGIMKGKHYVCLQHGITKDDLSGWLNGKKIDLFITATDAEYESIVENGSPYIMGKKEVARTGFPRHDSLLALSQALKPSEKNLLIMPTWRRYLVGVAKGQQTHEKELLPDFLSSPFATAWLGLLRSDRLKDLAKQYGFHLQFFPHSGMQGYFKDIEIDNAIEVLLHSDTTIQQLFAEATIMLTDYSSVAFEMCFLQKSILYYQFDEEDFFKGDHVYTKGYFDYRQDGFGPVVTEENALLDEIEALMKREGKPSTTYLERMEKAFPIRDGRNCERAYEAIIDLDKI